ncbi:hypothetical protein C8A00DRAFT_29031 [Chaetomidium leptoderma]|uniref:Uncharacterized protein n=1 Tax=Chaetomidium leptoderma TaxID=669021 RepID=A0AAN6VW90_9PEZI|nr:hypothetical protein C8A00DRAFT_29031 [Chaetomidium leptoderma]
MAFTWESIYSLFPFSPPASRNASPQGTPSILSSSFFSKSTTETTDTKQTDLPMPPTSAFGAGAPVPSPAESATSLAAGERDYFSPGYTTHRSPSMSSTSTASTTPSEQQQLQLPHHPQRSHTIPVNPEGESRRPAAPQRSATEVVALDTMSRSFPEPAHEPSLDELLARPPGKWSLGHYVKNARVPDAGKLAATEAEGRATKFEQVKRDLRRAQEEIQARRAGSHQ